MRERVGASHWEGVRKRGPHRAVHTATCSLTILPPSPPPSPVHVDVVCLPETAELANVTIRRAACHAGRHRVGHLDRATAQIYHCSRL